MGISAVIIGGSAGSFQVVTQIISSLRKDFNLPLFLCLHRLKHIRSGFVEALSIKSHLPIYEPDDNLAEENAAYCFEQVILFCTSLGLGTCWLGGTFNKSNFAAQVDLQPGEILRIAAIVSCASATQGMKYSFSATSFSKSNASISPTSLYRSAIWTHSAVNTFLYSAVSKSLLFPLS